MFLTPGTMIVFRLYLCTVGRIGFLDRFVKWIVLDRLIRNRQSRQVPSSRFFSPRELD